MSNKGGRKHLKKLATLRVRKIQRKDTVWSYKASPGPHPAEKSVPLAILIVSPSTAWLSIIFCIIAGVQLLLIPSAPQIKPTLSTEKLIVKSSGLALLEES